MIASAAEPGAAGHDHPPSVIASAAEPGAAGHDHPPSVIASAAEPGAAGHDHRRNLGRAATPGLATLIKARVPHEIFHFEAIEDLSASPGIAAEQVFKTLVIALPDELAVAIVPVPSRLSLKAAAAALGVAKAGMAEPATAQRATGYVVGGISPFGQRKRLRTVVDGSALKWDRVLCSAGKRHWDVAVAPRELIRLTGAVVADIRA